MSSILKTFFPSQHKLHSVKKKDTRSPWGYNETFTNWTILVWSNQNFHKCRIHRISQKVQEAYYDRISSDETSIALDEHNDSCGRVKINLLWNTFTYVHIHMPHDLPSVQIVLLNKIISPHEISFYLFVRTVITWGTCVTYLKAIRINIPHYFSRHFLSNYQPYQTTNHIENETPRVVFKYRLISLSGISN